MTKLMLKDVIGRKDINKLVDVSIKGQNFTSQYIDPVNVRLLKSVYIKQDKKGNNWLYVEWEPQGHIALFDDTTCNDCGYSGLMLGSNHDLNKLYLEAVK